MFFDYYGCSCFDVFVVVFFVEGVVKGCFEFGCVFVGGEMVEMFDFYIGDDYDVVGVVIGVMKVE